MTWYILRKRSNAHDPRAEIRAPDLRDSPAPEPDHRLGGRRVMALKPCEMCGREITDLFYSCPHCGAKCPPPKSVDTPSSGHGARSEVREDTKSPPASGSPPAPASRHTTHISSRLKKTWVDLKAAAAERKAAAERVKAIPRELLEIVSTSFLVKSCPSCYESAMRLLSVSPNGRSIEYKCNICGKRRRAVAANPKAQEVTGLFKDFGHYYGDTPVVQGNRLNVSHYLATR